MTLRKKLSLLLALAFVLFLGTLVFVGMPALLAATLAVILAGCGAAALAAGGGVDGSADTAAGATLIGIVLIVMVSAVGSIIACLFGHPIGSIHLVSWTGVAAFIGSMLIGKSNPQQMPRVEIALSAILGGLIVLAMPLSGVPFLAMIFGPALAGFGAWTLYSNS